MDLRQALKEAINAERGARGWSVRQLSDSSGVPYGTLRHYVEHDRDIPSLAITSIAHAFGMTSSELVIEAERRWGLGQ